MKLDRQDKVSRRCCSRGGRSSRRGGAKPGILQERDAGVAPMHGSWSWQRSAVCDLTLGRYTQVVPCATKDGLEGLVPGSRDLSQANRARIL